MDPLKNPYTPGAGTRPRALTGRQEEINLVVQLLERVATGYVEKSMLIVGLRGVGKTVLLNAFADIAEQRGFHTAHTEVNESTDLPKTMARLVRKVLLGIGIWTKTKKSLVRALGVLKSFSIKIPDGPELGLDVEALIGHADSGDLAEDLSDLLVEVGETAKQHGTQVLLLFDELQYLDRESLGSLVAALHRVSQKNLPLTFIGAGLPQLPTLVGDAKSYAERLFDFPEIGRLSSEAAGSAILDPANELKVEYTKAAITKIIDLTEGYPYFLQEYGKYIWNLAEKSPITVTDVDRAVPRVTQHLDSNFFRIRVDRATLAEKRYLRAMADLGNGPYKSGDIANRLSLKVTSVGPIRAQLINKGFIYSSGHGQSDFTVPHFADFLRRTYSSLELLSEG
jgi:hypothetical protein